MSGTIITRERQGGAKRYECRIRLKGKQKSKTFKLKRDADAFIARNSNEVYEGTYRQIRKVRFQEYIAHWKETYLIPEKLKPSTINGYGSYLAKHILPEFNDWQMTAIDTSEIVRFEARLLGEGLSQRTVRGVLVLLGRILEDARRERFIRISPMLDVERGKVDRTQRGRALSQEEAQKLLSKCNERLRLIVLFGLMSGLRRAEIFALHWSAGKTGRERSYVDFENNKIRVRETIFFRYGKYQARDKEREPAFVFVSPKSTRSKRDVHLSPALKRELREYFRKAPNKEGLIFATAEGAPIDPNGICKRAKDRDPQNLLSALEEKQTTGKFGVAVNRSGIGPVRFHDLRHTFGSMMLDQGENMYDVQRWMGHSSIQVTVDIYAHKMTDRGEEAARKTDVFMGMECATQQKSTRR